MAACRSARACAYACGGVTATYQLVGVAEADPSWRQISTDSPVGEAILARRPGDIVEVRAPRGTHRVEILEIDPAPEARAA
jgi:transcription elongation factor GreA